MKLSEAISTYVQRRHLEGSTYINGEEILRSFQRRTGDVSLDRVSDQDVVGFLNGPRTRAITKRGKYSMLSRFLQFWASRDEMPVLILTPPPLCKPAYAPYIYTRSQIRTLLTTTRISQKRSPLVDAATLRMFLLTLYATGALVSEAIGLRLGDLDHGRRRLTLQNRVPARRRCIPICQDFRSEILAHLRSRHRGRSLDVPLFSTISGEPLNQRYLDARFRRLRKLAAVARRDTYERPACMQDLRATFAVHRLTSWIKQGVDLNRVLPSLSVYMGYSGLAAAEKYLPLTPERFRKELRMLSPQRGRSHWRDDKKLMHFLHNL